MEQCNRVCGDGTPDPRDRFIALAGISKNVSDGFIDYTKSFTSVAIHAGLSSLVSRHLSNSKNPTTCFGLDILALTAVPRNKELGLPTWIPDLTPGSHSRSGSPMTVAYSSKFLRRKKYLSQEDYVVHRNGQTCALQEDFNMSQFPELPKVIILVLEMKVYGTNDFI